MASAPTYDLFYMIIGEMLFPPGEHEDDVASEPQDPYHFVLSGCHDEGRARRVVWPYARIACRSSFKGNC